MNLGSVDPWWTPIVPVGDIDVGQNSALIWSKIN